MQICQQTILIISPSSRLRSSLRVLLKSVLPETQIEELTDPDLAGQYLLDDPTCLILLDADLQGTFFIPTKDKIKLYVILLTHSIEQMQCAKRLGYHAIMVDEFSPEELSLLLDELK